MAARSHKPILPCPTTGTGEQLPADQNSPFDADEHGGNKLRGEKCCLLKLAAAGAPPSGVPGAYICPPDRFEANVPRCVEEGVTEA